VQRIAVVTAPERIPALAAAPWLPSQVVAVVAGGARRQESVAAGVAALSGAPHVGRRPVGAEPATVSDPVILVHDAARPMASTRLVRAVAESAARHGAAIPVLPVAETLKRLEGRLVGQTVDRDGLATAQTPQGVRRSLLERAWQEFPPDGPETWTDEASVLAACRIPVHAVGGEGTNLKVTVPADLELARAMADRAPAASRASSGLPAAADPPIIPASVAMHVSSAGAGGARVGLGVDSHPFGPGAPLRLGGITFEGVPRLAGHSDGDAALHAVADALLGAAGLGDLGRLFPADARTPAGIDSRILLASVATAVAEAGWSIGSVDLTITAARPHLGQHLAAMSAAIADVLGLDSAVVNVKAYTGNLVGPEGSGRSISASAIAWLVPGDPAQGTRS
jgi:2-C-methyl-D-erythritol 4-phosphate cytidylyltransferase/2-C-methyl-D-erythritol 2,4-cyclodiphosphate synthase